ncbi:MAG: fumarylacetoacetate hydrolase family protein [Dehalococcoidia bacterium]
MRIIRFSKGGKTRYGVEEGGKVRILRGSPFNRLTFDGTVLDVSEVRLLAPCTPSKIVCLGLNYRSHAAETGLPIPKVPLIFLKPSTAVIGPGEHIVLPRGTKRTDYEGELGVVMGRKAKEITEKEASDCILGYTCFNDVTERHNQREDGQWTRAKGYDTFAPLGPYIETEVSPDDLKIETCLNGKICQSCRTSDLIFSILRIVTFISGVMTLLPGDVIATGTPSGIGRLQAGDFVEICIESIGTLGNPVRNLP